MSPKSNRGVAWLHSEVKALLDIWTNPEIQEQLAGRLHNMCIYDKISRQLKDLGFYRTGEQCREKIKKLRRDYKNVVNNNFSPIYARRLQGFYDTVHAIFGKSMPQKHIEYDENTILAENSDNVNEINHESFLSDLEIETNIGTTASMGIESHFEDANSVTTNRIDSSDTGNIHNAIIIEGVNEVETPQNIYSKCDLLHDTLKSKQDMLNNIFIDLERKRFVVELERDKQRLMLLERQRQEAKCKELHLYKSLLELLAKRKGFTINFAV